jgi:serine O-acetyltransferase
MKSSNKNPRSVEYSPKGSEWLYYFSHKLSLNNLNNLAKIVKRINQFIFHVNIYPEVIIGNGLQLPHGGFGVVMHHDTEIGSDAIIFHNVTIANGGARIGDRVYIGTGAVIIGKVSIGNDVVIGANAVVNFDIPDGGLALGPKATLKNRD